MSKKKRRQQIGFAPNMGVRNERQSIPQTKQVNSPDLTATEVEQSTVEIPFDQMAHGIDPSAIQSGVAKTV